MVPCTHEAGFDDTKFWIVPKNLGSLPEYAKALSINA